MSESSPQKDLYSNELFRDIDSEYTKQRLEYEDQKNKREMHDRVREIVRVGSNESDDSIETKRGGNMSEGVLTITVADIEYGSEIKSGEDAVVKRTRWIPAGQRKINGMDVDLSILFESHDFTRFSDEGPKTRFGPVFLHAKAKDKDGIEVEFPIVSFRIEEDGKAAVRYSGRHNMKLGTPDYKEMQDLVSLAEVNLGIAPPANQSNQSSGI